MSFKLFIEARDAGDPSSVPAYTTLDVHVSNAAWALASKPYFDPSENQRVLFFKLLETLSNATVLFDFKTILVVPDSRQPVSFFLFDTSESMQQAQNSRAYHF